MSSSDVKMRVLLSDTESYGVFLLLFGPVSGELMRVNVIDGSSGKKTHLEFLPISSFWKFTKFIPVSTLVVFRL